MRSSCIIPQRPGYVFVFVEPEYPYHQISQGRHNARSRFCANLAEVLMEGNVPHIVQPVFNTPVPTIQLQQPLRRAFFSIKTGNSISCLFAQRLAVKRCCDAVDPHDLLMEREVYVSF